MCGIGACIYGYWDGRFLLIGAACFFAALMYWSSIRWVDQHGTWSSASSGRSQVTWVFWLVAAIAGVAVFVVALVFFAYYQIPQNGMYPGLPAGSRLLAIRRPYRDVAEVRRGDIVVFSRSEAGMRYLYIWRVVGLPGDNISTTSDGVLVNGVPLTREKTRSDAGMVIYRETNGETAYEVAYGERAPAQPVPEVTVTVPAGHVFVLGDNRHNARDSRYFGSIPFDSILARKW